MDIDGPSNLKRSSSAPMINEPAPPPPSRELVLRTRRFSASCSGGGNGGSEGEGGRPSGDRVLQLRREERLELGREQEHEREMMQMSQSCEDLALLGTPSTAPPPPLPAALPSLPSLATPPRPCWLRGGHRPQSPSPTRKTFLSRRSLSPIAFRPSPLTPVKRKFEIDSDSDSCSSFSPPAKRPFGGETMLSPNSGKFLFRPVSSVTPRDEPMDEGNGGPKQSPLAQQPPSKSLQEPKDTIMVSLDPS
ncbi:P2R1A-PPP2R2A-interacting phosphatase regulator 1 [Neocloeon triangulifer]|uniref:P2R1A-PPP2R2A-interacting phosphatase regulator 1 n=1 Tax=Neocloeon triangulifer TaxID=2078957 RepID=UPI00286EF9D4|nr:P2R1A-PPP2R2A-interacting phosphatase regulator 1 [Neocloeon triangulifer]